MSCLYRYKELRQQYQSKITAVVKELKQEKKKLARLEEERKFVIDTLAHRVTEIRNQLHMLQLEARAAVLLDLEESSIEAGVPATPESDRKSLRSTAREATKMETHMRLARNKKW